MMKDAKRYFTGDENHAITKAEALTYIRQFQEHYGPQAPGCFFDKDAVQAILNQPDAVGLRYYYGLDAFDQTQLVLVGTNARRNDLLEGEPVKVSIMNPPLTADGDYNREEVSHEIPLEAAADLTARFQESLKPGQPKGGFFGKKAIQKLLDEPGCVGLRFLFGAKNDGTRVIVMLCVDKLGADMFQGPMLDLSASCPPFCGWQNLLNRGTPTKTRLTRALSI